MPDIIRRGQVVAQGTVLPATCAPNDLFFLTVDPIGLYLAPTTDAWVMYDNVIPAALTVTATTPGIAPATGGGTENYFRADGTFATPGGGVSPPFAIADTTGLQTALDGKQASGSYATGTGTANGTNTGDQTITLTGNVTGTGTGSFAATIATAAVTLAKMADVATSTVFYRKTAATGAPEVQTLATLKTDLVLVKGDVGLGNVDNTTDAGKPVSSATQTALNLKAALASPTFTGTVTLPATTIGDGVDVTIGATTGTKFGQSTSKLGFFGITPVVRPTAITQTYSTASATHANVTQLAAPAGGTGATAGAYNTAANRDLMIVSVNAARTDIANVKQVLNQVIDQLQALGLLQ